MCSSSFRKGQGPKSVLKATARAVDASGQGPSAVTVSVAAASLPKVHPMDKTSTNDAAAIEGTVVPLLISRVGLVNDWLS